MSENYNDEIIDNNEDAEKKKDHSEKFCFLCRRPESKAGPMIELPNNIHVCTDCMQKSFNSMNQQDVYKRQISGREAESIFWP